MPLVPEVQGLEQVRLRTCVVPKVDRVGRAHRDESALINYHKKNVYSDEYSRTICIWSMYNILFTDNMWAIYTMRVKESVSAPFALLPSSLGT